jgi:ankyrin repeat protein
LGHAAVIEELCELAQPEYINKRNSHGFTALHEAAINGRSRAVAVRSLQSSPRGAKAPGWRRALGDPYWVDFPPAEPGYGLRQCRTIPGAQLRSLCADSGCVSRGQALVEAGAAVDREGPSRSTPLHLACRCDSRPG